MVEEGDETFPRDQVGAGAELGLQVKGVCGGVDVSGGSVRAKFLERWVN